MTDWLEFLGVNRTRILGDKAKPAKFAEEVWLTQGTPCTFGRRWPMVKLHHQIQIRMAKFQSLSKHILVARRVKHGQRRAIQNWDEM